MKRPVPVESASALIDEKIKELGDWRGKTLAKVRESVHEAALRRVEVDGDSHLENQGQAPDFPSLALPHFLPEVYLFA